MSFYFLIYTILIIKMFIFVGSTPKLGHILFDLLAYEANVSMDKTTAANTTDSQYLRSNITNQEISTNKKTHSNGYDFDETKCKQKKDRVLCGYDKNKDSVESEEELEESENGCRIRGDRLECGYLIGPFTNPRRPPANNEELEDSTNSTQSEIYQKLTTQATVTTSKKTSTTRKTAAHSPISSHNTNQSTNKLNASLTTTPIPKLTTSVGAKFVNKLSMKTTENKSIETSKSKCIDNNDTLFCITFNLKEKS